MNHHTTRATRLVTGAVALAAAATTVLAGPAQAAGSTGSTGASGTGTSPVAEQVAPLVQPSVVYETITWTGYVYDRWNRQYLRDKPFTVRMQCTGFVVNPDGWVATAGHCVDAAGGQDALRRAAAEWALQNYYPYPGALGVEDVIGDYRVDTLGSDNQVKHNQADREVGVSWGAAVSGVEVQKRKPARVVAFQKFEEGDGALLKVDETDLNAIELADTADVEINSGVVAIGYPAIIDSFTDPDLTPTFDTGNVSSIKSVAHGLLRVFQLSASLSGGMSGGPTVDDDGNVIGVNSSHFVGEPFNYAVPAERIAELLASAGVDNEVSATTQTYRDGIRAYFHGDRTAAVRDLGKVLEEQPANGLAAEYLAKAKKLPLPPKPARSATPWVILGIGVVASIVVGLVLLALLVRRLRRRSPVPAPVAPATPSYDAAWVPAQAPVPAPHEPELVGAGAPLAPASPVAPASVAPASVAPASVAPIGFAPPTSSAARFCTACGHEAPAGSDFCGGCGARLA